MQKTLLYIAILAILGFGVWYFLINDRRVGEAGFTVIDTGAIGKIFIAPNSSENTVTIERRAEGWIVNNEYPVLQSTLKQLLTTLHNQRALFPVQDNQRDPVVRSLIASGIKVEIYDREGRKMRGFFVGNEMGRFSGTAMLKEGSERPYVVQIPGFEGYLTTRYTADIKAWRDRLVFDYAPEEIEEVSVSYPARATDNFTIYNRDGKLDVKLDPAVRPAAPLNDRRVLSYLRFFKRMFNENYHSYRGLDTIVASMPEVATVRVKAIGNRATEVRFMNFPVDARDLEIENPSQSAFNTDRYFAIMNGGRDTATVQTQMFEKLFRRGSEFYTPDQRADVKIPGAGQ